MCLVCIKLVNHLINKFRSFVLQVFMNNSSVLIMHFMLISMHCLTLSRKYYISSAECLKIDDIHWLTNKELF